MIIDKFEKIINYKFKNESLLFEALTHSSSKVVKSNKKKNNYERLEFLGDRVLGLVLAEYFFTLFPESNEGFLNDYFQNYANQDFLSQFAKKIRISDFIKTQKGDNLDNNKSDSKNKITFNEDIYRYSHYNRSISNIGIKMMKI